MTLFGYQSNRIGIFKGGNRVIDKTYFITMLKLTNLPEYTLGQNIVISVHHKRKCCESRKNIVGIKEVNGGGQESGSIRDKRGRKSGKYGKGDGRRLHL